MRAPALGPPAVGPPVDALGSHDGFFVDLFVRVSNKVAISMYEKVGRQPPLGAAAHPRAPTSPSPARHHHARRAPAQFGYSVYRRVRQYYTGEEDAFDMRKAMPRDAGGKSTVPLGRDIMPWELEHD